MELQKERETSNNVQIQLMKVQDQRSKLKEKNDAAKKKTKKINDLSK